MAITRIQRSVLGVPYRSTLGVYGQFGSSTLTVQVNGSEKSGVTVTVLNMSTSATTSDTTDASGEAAFGNLGAGLYKITCTKTDCFTMPSAKYVDMSAPGTYTVTFSIFDETFSFEEGDAGEESGEWTTKGNVTLGAKHSTEYKYIKFSESPLVFGYLGRTDGQSMTGRIRRNTVDEPKLTIKPQWNYAILRYLTVGAGLSHDIEEVDEVTKCYVEFNTYHLDNDDGEVTCSYTDDMDYYVFLGWNGLSESGPHDLTADAFYNWTQGAMEIRVANGVGSLYSVGTLVRVNEDNGIGDVNYTGFQGTVASVDTAPAGYDVIYVALDETAVPARTSYGARIWKVPDIDLYLYGLSDAVPASELTWEYQGKFTTNDDVDSVTIHLDPERVYSIIQNEYNLELYIIPKQMLIDPGAEFASYVGIGNGNLQFEYDYTEACPCEAGCPCEADCPGDAPPECCGCEADCGCDGDCPECGCGDGYE